ncbi:hypothetical protein [Salinactinospora qingdaonensis]|uniref:Response regulator receiver domain-containing protein n=1 Tax=Salinactinospora qingdaonensis TaxID=702744 RepID=A0ABP7G642_9ACTN
MRAGGVGGGPELREALLRRRPEVAVVDVRLPPRFTVMGKAVSKHINAVVSELDLPSTDREARRVRVVLSYLDG